MNNMAHCFLLIVCLCKSPSQIAFKSVLLNLNVALLFQIGCSVPIGTSDLPMTTCLIAFGMHLDVC